jgi:hypothetical protein
MLSYLLAVRLITPIKQMSDLVKVCAVAAAADAFSFLIGPTLYAADALARFYREPFEHPVPFVDFFLIKVPDFYGFFWPMMGMADWIIISFLAYAAMELGLNDNFLGPPSYAMSRSRRPGVYFPAAAMGGLLCVFAARILDIFIPALPFVGALFLVRIWRSSGKMRKMGIGDKFLSAGIIAFPALIILIGLVFVDGHLP